ncbi:MAG: hypothetical protein KAV18_06345 [Candidatus Omnitrophica bacterium]|nr:hypothetical protein [Candidatus Omnitrophota bacterium]
MKFKGKIMSLEVKILLITANTEIQTTISSRTVSHNCLLDTVFDGMEALDKVKETEYSLIFVDKNMRSLDAFATAKIIKNLLPKAQLWILFDETSDDEQKEIMALAHQFEARCLFKPLLASQIDIILSEKKDEHTRRDVRAG